MTPPAPPDPVELRSAASPPDPVELRSAASPPDPVELRSAASPPLHRLIARAVPAIRGGRPYHVDPAISQRSLLAELRARATSLLAAQWRLRGVAGPRLRFCEDGVRIAHRRHLTMGAGSVLERGVTIRALARDGVVLGRGVTIGRWATMECTGVLHELGAGIRLGDNSSLGDYGFIGAAAPVVVGNDVLVGQRVAIHAQNHVYDDPRVPINRQGTTEQGVTIGDDCWIGTGAVILDGVELGTGTVVAAGAVVTHSCPPYSVLAGVPARVVRSRA
ncbi:acyltransferase [Actinomycetospora sp. NBRC 106378]|uniref:acyltransferase n=1 Tax=Actinomycetospora sp. NBRC 106378 TaxID=3032208 RepID=UPI0024A2E2B2|nr:acyltransferase [Actinomycetospora sp. NBRC 106378]GLZ51768.1 hypothetical protein Acsp07_13850 [Actinomycetospora sp. NBRC 106378]